MDNALIVVAATTAFRYYACARISKKKNILVKDGITMQAVGHVSSLNIYPVKSFRGLKLTEAHCSPTGMTTIDKRIHDRQWIVCVEKDGFVQGQSRREVPKLALISTSVHKDNLIFEAPGMKSLTIPLNIKLDKTADCHKTMIRVAPIGDSPIGGIDCGQLAAKWLDRFLGKTNLRLVLISPDVSLRPQTRKTELGHTETYNVRAHDVSPFNFASEASLDDMNSRLEEVVGMNQFRPNIEVSGCEPYAEDEWQKLYVGSAVFEKITKCFRCMLVTVNETTGTKHPDCEPHTTLKTYRPTTQYNGTTRPFFGVWHKLVKPGTIHVGDTIWLVGATGR